MGAFGRNIQRISYEMINYRRISSNLLFANAWISATKRPIIDSSSIYTFTQPRDRERNMKYTIERNLVARLLHNVITQKVIHNKNEMRDGRGKQVIRIFCKDTVFFFAAKYSLTRKHGVLKLKTQLIFLCVFYMETREIGNTEAKIYFRDDG